MAAAMDEGLDEIKHESVDLVRIDPICVFRSFASFSSFNRSVDPVCTLVFGQLVLKVLRSAAFNCSLFRSNNAPTSQENIPVEEVFVKLKCSTKGLTTSDAQARIAMFGPNKLEEKKVRSRSMIRLV